ncbi:MAG: cytochrome c oxidase subunit 2A [Ilumatobacteraceae bacterium]|nr:cytochrome c oxidase subunit 2A [Acidimicrobiales bacterium]MCB9394830.1 cytochrome c oxidase subunit 2A [Acidimicrobiaceae bacterium]
MGPQHDHDVSGGDLAEQEHFKPTGTMFMLAMFVVVIVLLWASVYVILLSRGVTV